MEHRPAFLDQGSDRFGGFFNRVLDRVLNRVRKCRILGGILNDVHVSRLGHYYSDYYYYGYSRYYRDYYTSEEDGD